MSKRRSRTARISTRLYEDIERVQHEWNIPNFTTASEIYAEAIKKKLDRAKKADKDGDFIDFF